MKEHNINETIDKLLIIQERDVRMIQCQREIAQIPRQKKEIECEANKIRDETRNAKNEYKSQQAEIKKIELEIEALRQKIVKLREQQLQIKSNEEFRALNSEITGLNEDIKKMEDQEIGVMEKAENVRQKEAKALHDSAEMDKTIKERLTAVEQRKSNLETEVKQLKADRDLIAKDVAGEFLSVYNRIIENKKDKALVMVENSACAGCHMHLPPHVVCDLKKRTKLVACSFCGRILYLVH